MTLVGMQLPRGITGFRHSDDPPLPLSDFAAFRGHCHAAARAIDSHMRSVETPMRSISANFGRVVIDLRDGPVAILLNADFPVIAFAESSTQIGEPMRFRDAPGLAEVFRGFATYEVWSRSKLESPVQPETCANLAEAELEQARYWEPQRVGDLVFNYWD